MSAPNPFSSTDPWDDVAEGYAEEADWVMGPFSERAIALAGLTPGHRVLDVACGPGTLCLRAADIADAVTATDFSRPMLSHLRRKAAGRTNIDVLHADGQALPLPDASFDAAFSMFGLMFFPDRVQGFREMHRTLRPGGVAIVSSWAPISRSPMMQLMFGALKAADDSRPDPKDDPLSLENPELLRAEMLAGGFSTVEVVAHEAALQIEGVDSFWQAMTRSSAPLRMLAKKLGPEVWAQQQQAALDYVRAQLPELPTTRTTSAWLAVGRK